MSAVTTTLWLARAALTAMSLDRQVRFDTPPLRSLNCRPQVGQRNRR